MTSPRPLDAYASDVESLVDGGWMKVERGAREWLQASLLEWYDGHARSLPWRDAPTPYAVWVSELMLQQTRVRTALPYFERWMSRFPEVSSLAAASIEEVLALWSGLGYYRRARHLHAGAQAVMLRHQGQLPADVKALLALPGIGPYTAGAIASIAFGERVPLVDGNVNRVLTRRFGLSGDPMKAPLKAKLWTLAEALVPQARPGDHNQALMELGAQICTPKGWRCSDCPWREGCAAADQDKQAQLPTPKARKRSPLIVAAALIGTRPNGEVLLARRGKGLLDGLWSVPIEVVADLGDAKMDIKALVARYSQRAEALARSLSPEVVTLCARPPVKHIFTHRRYLVLPFLAEIAGATLPEPTQAHREWRLVSAEGLAGLGVPALARVILGAGGLVGK